MTAVAGPQEPDDFIRAAVHTVELLAGLEPAYPLWLVVRHRPDGARIAASTGAWAGQAPPGGDASWLAALAGATPGAGDGRPWVSDVPAGSRVLGLPSRPGERARTYAGTPVFLPDGRRVATVCGLSPAPADAPAAARVRGALETARVLLGAVAALAAESLAPVPAADGDHDPLTGLHTARAFEDLCELEEARCRLFGVHASIVLLEPAPPPAALLAAGIASDAGPAGRAARAAAVLRRVCAPCDVLARLDPTTFAVLAPESDIVAAQALKVRLRKALRREGVFIRAGHASRRHDESLRQTTDRARVALGLDRALQPVRRG